MVYSRRCESRRYEKSATARSSTWLRARFSPVSFPLALSPSHPFSSSPPEPFRSSFPITRDLSVSLSISLFCARESLENSVKVSSSRRVVSLWGFEGRIVSLSIPLPRWFTLSLFARSTESSYAPTLSPMTTLSEPPFRRNQTRNARSDFENRSLSFGAFWVAHPRRPFSAPSLSRFFLSFMADLFGDRPASLRSRPSVFLQRAESGLSRFVARPAFIRFSTVRKNRIRHPRFSKIQSFRVLEWELLVITVISVSADTEGMSSKEFRRIRIYAWKSDILKKIVDCLIILRKSK